jgi:two-component system, LytTR family, response regulator
MLSITNTSTVILVPTCNGITIIDTSTIIRVQSISNYSKLFFSNGKTLVVAKVLSWFEEKLPGQLFIRVHRSHIVGLNYVQAYCNSGSTRVILQDNTAIDISRRKRVAVLRVFRELQAA